MRTFIIAGFIPFLLAMQASTGSPAPVRLTRASELTASPSGERIGVLLSGLTVTPVEEQGDWVRVHIEGWIPRRALTAHAGESTALESPDLIVPAPVVHLATRLEGTIFVTDHGMTQIGHATAVRLVSSPEELADTLKGIHAECDTNHAELLETAAELKKERNRALRIEDTTKAFDAYDKAKWARTDILRRIEALDTACAERIETILDDHEVARTLSDREGRFSFAQIEPGSYLLHAQFDTDKKRFAWDIPIVLEAAASLAIDLTNSNLTHTAPLNDY
ncbi:MAG: hypothetical protein ACE5HU_07105 [Acidobacteriota bacterium]